MVAIHIHPRLRSISEKIWPFAHSCPSVKWRINVKLDLRDSVKCRSGYTTLCFLLNKHEHPCSGYLTSVQTNRTEYGQMSMDKTHLCSRQSRTTGRFPSLHALRNASSSRKVSILPTSSINSFFSLFSITRGCFTRSGGVLASILRRTLDRN